MNTTPVAPRILGLVRTIREVMPDVICLQELTRESYRIITNDLCETPSRSPNTAGASERNDSDSENVRLEDKTELYQYIAHCGSDWPHTLSYFCAMFTRRDLFVNNSTFTSDSVQFALSKSNMSRGFVHVTGTLRSSNGASTQQKISLITSHLESLKQSTVKRKLQLKHILDVQRGKANAGFVTIFAGDTNLRENEIPTLEIETKKVAVAGRDESKSEPGGSKLKFQDAWALNGCSAENEFTWDMAENNNLSYFQELASKPQTRYDRAFLMPPLQPMQFKFPLPVPRFLMSLFQALEFKFQLTVPKFQLLGKTRLDCEKFVSDHWGLLLEVTWGPVSHEPGRH